MTNKKFIREMNKEELELVFKNNSKLRNDIYEDMVDSEMHWVGDYLSSLKEGLSDWSIGADNRNYLKVGNNDLFVDGVIKLQKDYCFLADDENDFINSISNKISKLNSTEMYSDEFDNLEEEIDEDVNTLANKIVNQFTKQFNSFYKEEYQLEYFIEFYAESRLDENSYIITDDNDYVLYEDISYTKNYSK